MYPLKWNHWCSRVSLIDQVRSLIPTTCSISWKVDLAANAMIRERHKPHASVSTQAENKCVVQFYHKEYSVTACDWTCSVLSLRLRRALPTPGCRRTGNYWNSLMLILNSLNFISHLVENSRTKITRDATYYLRELKRSFRFSFWPQADRLEPGVPL